MRGFSQEILALISWVLSFFGSYKYGENFANSLNKLIDNIVISSIASYVITFIIFMIVLSLITKSFSNLIKKSYIGLVDRTGGFLFGLLRGYLIVSLCFFTFHYFYNGEKIIWIEKSKFNFVTLISNEKILKFFNEKNEFTKKLRQEIDSKSNSLFEKSIDSQIKLKKFMDQEKKIYNETDKNSLDYLIENSE
tara:strand:- start:103 stop:681 length:579 start_codon:yes stop_codon:yes gene_type:complete